MSETRETPSAPYEHRDVDMRGLAITAAVIALGLPASLLLAWWVLGLGAGISGADLPLFPAVPEPPQPHLQVSPRQDLEAFLAGKRQRLTSYGWIDRERGLVHVPIEVAMEHVLEDGVPRWTPPATDEPGVTAQRARQRALQPQQENGP